MSAKIKPGIIMKPNAKHLPAQDKNKLIRVLQIQGDGLKRGVNELLTKRDTGYIIKIVSKLPEVRTMQDQTIRWLTLGIIKFTPQQLLEAINEPEIPKLKPLPRPTNASNMNEWFLDKHELQIVNILRSGGSIRSIVRQYNDAYFPDLPETHAFESIRKRIKRIKIDTQVQTSWLSQHPDIHAQILQGNQATKVYPLAKLEGYDGSLRTFQRMAKKIKE